MQRLRTAKHDTDKVNAYYSLSRLYWNKNTDSALLMAQKSLDLAIKINFEKGMALAYLSKGVVLVSEGKYPEALDYHFKCLRLSLKLGLPGLTGNEYNNIGIVYADMENFDKALYYYRLSYQIAMKQNDPTGYVIYGLLVNTGEIFKQKGQPDSAIACNLKALVPAERVKDSVGIATALFNIGENYITKKNYETSRSYLNKALSIAEKVGDNEGAAYCYNALALIGYYTGKYDQSLLYAQKGLNESKRLAIVDVEKGSYHALYLSYQKIGNYQKALLYRDLENVLNDSLNSVAKQRAINNIQSTYELEQKQYQIDLLNKDRIIGQKKLDEVKARRNLLAAGIVGLLILLFIQFRGFLQKKKLNKQLAIKNNNISAQNKKLEELVGVRDRLFSIIGHDLRGPVYAVGSIIDMVKEEGLSGEELRFWIDKASETTVVISHLLENLLYWSKSQMDGIVADEALFDVQKVIEQSILLVKSRAEEKKVLIKAISLAGSSIVYGDETMLYIVIRNLIENAVKFSKPGDEIMIAAERKPEFMLVTVKDNGRGIPEEEQQKIFNKLSFYTTYGTANEKGSGLGLLLCKELVERNNGSLWFESKAGLGSSFFFTIPLNATLFNSKLFK